MFYIFLTWRRRLYEVWKAPAQESNSQISSIDRVCRFVVCLLQKQLHISLLISRYLFDSSFNVTTPKLWMCYQLKIFISSCLMVVDSKYFKQENIIGLASSPLGPTTLSVEVRRGWVNFGVQFSCYEIIWVSDFFIIIFIMAKITFWDSIAGLIIFKLES